MKKMKKAILRKLLIATSLVFLSALAGATVRPVNVADSTISTVSGVGGYTEVVYAFAKGDKLTLVANASKLLDRAMVVLAPQTVLLRVKGTKKINETFEMPADGTVTIRFISDRGGVNNIRYSIVRLPASEATQDFNTKTAPPANNQVFHQ